MLNELARAKLIERGILDDGEGFKTADGHRKFASGDQIVFLKNEASLGVKNGMLAKVVETGSGRIVAEIGNGEYCRKVSVEQRFYNTVDHGYATTVHKAQGATLDRVKVLASLSLDRHLTYVAMTRHREDLTVYYGARSFAKAGGLVPILSRRNAKETTLDYAGGSFYGQALRFAEARGLHIVNVARTIARDRLEWTVRQKQKLVDLGCRLTAIGARIGLPTSVSKTIPIITKEAKPMVAGITTFPKSIDQAVEDKLAADPALKTQWGEVSMRFHHVYAQPEAAFKAVGVDAMLWDQTTAKSVLAKIASEPEAFGALKGKTGMFASRIEKSDRERALNNVSALADSISDYLRQRNETERQHQAQELASRRQNALEIPALTAHARQVLERVRDAIDRNDLPAGLEHALADKLAKAELEGFVKAVSERFGERTFLPLAAKEANGEVFHRVTAGMNPTQRYEVQQAWTTMWTAQKLSAHERTATALKASEAMRQTKSQGLTLK